MKQRILSLLLALTLLCAMLPQIALPARAEDAYSGKCGDNLTWRFAPSTGTLTIEGSGAMFSRNIRWREHNERIKQVIFPAGLTHIGDYTFFGCTGLTSVILYAVYKKASGVRIKSGFGGILFLLELVYVFLKQKKLFHPHLSKHCYLTS